MSARTAVFVLLLMTAGHPCAANEERPAPATKPAAQAARSQAAATSQKPLVPQPAPQSTPKVRKQSAPPPPARLDRKALGLGCSSGED